MSVGLAVWQISMEEVNATQTIVFVRAKCFVSKASILTNLAKIGEKLVVYNETGYYFNKEWLTYGVFEGVKDLNIRNRRFCDVKTVKIIPWSYENIEEKMGWIAALDLSTVNKDVRNQIITTIKEPQIVEIDTNYSKPTNSALSVFLNKFLPST